jgi:dynein light chain Tctex-type 1
VTVLIGEKKKEIDVGLHTALSCLWNGTTDGCLTVKWENKSVFSIISVFGLTV